MHGKFYILMHLTGVQIFAVSLFLLFMQFLHFTTAQSTTVKLHLYIFTPKDECIASTKVFDFKTTVERSLQMNSANGSTGVYVNVTYIPLNNGCGLTNDETEALRYHMNMVRQSAETNGNDQNSFFVLLGPTPLTQCNQVTTWAASSGISCQTVRSTIVHQISFQCPISNEPVIPTQSGLSSKQLACPLIASVNQLFSTLNTMSIGVTVSQLSAAFTQVLNRFGWINVTVVYQQEPGSYMDYLASELVEGINQLAYPKRLVIRTVGWSSAVNLTLKLQFPTTSATSKFALKFHLRL